MGTYQLYILSAALNYRNTVVYVKPMKSSPYSNISLVPLTNIFSVCYGLNVCVYPQIHMLKPNPNVMVLGGGGLWEVMRS